MTVDAVRAAVLAEDYRAAAQLFSDYARTVDASAVSALLQWTRRAVLCRRAHTEARLQTLRDAVRVLTAYGR